jgi:hypothetical protein
MGKQSRRPKRRANYGERHHERWMTRFEARRRLGPPGHHPARPHRWAHDDASLAALAAYNAARRVDGSLCRLFTEMFGRQPAFPDRLTGDEREELVDFMARP